MKVSQLGFISLNSSLQDDEVLQDFEQTQHYFISSAGANFLYLACEKEMLSI